MIGTKPVTLSRNAFRFCRWSMALLIWLGVLLHLPVLVGICAGIMLLSAILTVRNAPMVWLYTVTLNRIKPSPPEVVDEHGMRLAHTLAFVLMTVGLFLASNAQTTETGWKLLFVVAIFKTAGAIGYCPISRGFTCLLGNGGQCCRIFKRPSG